MVSGVSGKTSAHKWKLQAAAPRLAKTPYHQNVEPTLHFSPSLRLSNFIHPSIAIQHHLIWRPVPTQRPTRSLGVLSSLHVCMFDHSRLLRPLKLSLPSQDNYASCRLKIRALTWFVTQGLRIEDCWRIWSPEQARGLACHADLVQNSSCCAVS